MIATITRHEVGTVERALRIFLEFGLIVSANQCVSAIMLCTIGHLKQTQAEILIWLKQELMLINGRICYLKISAYFFWDKSGQANRSLQLVSQMR